MRESVPNVSSSYATEGTTAHWVGEESLRWEAPAAKLIGKVCPETGETVTAEMAEAVQVYVDECNRVKGDYHRIEEKVTLEEVSSDLGGTVDFAAVMEKRVLHIRDYKHGMGVNVAIEGNVQLRIYALGALALYSKQRPGAGPLITSIVPGIVQPRIEGGEPVKLEKLLTSELIAWQEEVLKPGVARVQLADEGQLSEDERLVAGAHCKFCPAKAVCPAQAKQNLALAQIDFAKPMPVMTLPNPQAMSIAKLATILQAKDAFDSWLSAIEAHAQAVLESGKPVPGFKLVKKRSNRAWRSESAAATALSKTLGKNAYKPQVLISPAEAEKQLKVFSLTLSEDLVVKPDTGNVIALASDKRPAATIETASSAFLALDEMFQ